MSLDNLNEVDVIGIDNETGVVTLAIADDWSWDEEEDHLRALQDKINIYLSFVESNEIYETYPNAMGRDVEIKIYAKYPLPEIARRFVDQAFEIVSEAGFRLVVSTEALK